MSDAAAQPGQTITVGGQAMTPEMAWAVVRKSAHWFWWIAGLSLANSIMSAFDSKYAMVLGLGVTQLIDALFAIAAEESGKTISTAMQLVHFAVVLVPIAMFFFLGRSAAKGNGIAWIVGMVLYLLDGLMFVLAGDWLAVGFHAFVLFMLWAGYGTMRQVRAAERASPPPVPETATPEAAAEA